MLQLQPWSGAVRGICSGHTAGPADLWWQFFVSSDTRGLSLRDPRSKLDLRMRQLKGELLQQQQEKQGLDSSHSSGEPGLGWSNTKVLNSVLWSLWKIKCNNHLRVWNSKVDCCVVSENRQLDQTPFNACIFFFFEKTL